MGYAGRYSVADGAKDVVHEDVHYSGNIRYSSSAILAIDPAMAVTSAVDVAERLEEEIALRVDTAMGHIQDQVDQEWEAELEAKRQAALLKELGTIPQGIPQGTP